MRRRRSFPPPPQGPVVLADPHSPTLFLRSPFTCGSRRRGRPPRCPSRPKGTWWTATLSWSATLRTPRRASGALRARLSPPSRARPSRARRAPQADSRTGSRALASRACRRVALPPFFRTTSFPVNARPFSWPSAGAPHSAHLQNVAERVMLDIDLCGVSKEDRSQSRPAHPTHKVHGPTMVAAQQTKVCQARVFFWGGCQHKTRACLCWLGEHHAVLSAPRDTAAPHGALAQCELTTTGRRRRACDQSHPERQAYMRR